MTTPPIAESYADIAAALRELERQRAEAQRGVECLLCGDTGVLGGGYPCGCRKRGDG